MLWTALVLEGERFLFVEAASCPVGQTTLVARASGWCPRQRSVFEEVSEKVFRLLVSAARCCCSQLH